jgi:tetratricopeptide (TPR) repeat protein
MADSTGGRRAALHAEALAGHLALARGDTAEAIGRLDALQPSAGHSRLLWLLDEPLAIEKSLLAELLLSQGEYERAIDVARLFDHRQPVMFLPYLAKSLSIRLRAAEALGNTELADRCRQRLLALGRSDLVQD